MDSLLLSTKVQVPPLPAHLVHRARLVDYIEQRIADYKLVQLSAPAGYGKTTLLLQWAHTSHFPIAWLSLSEEVNDIERFFRYLLTAWEEVRPGVSESPLGHLLGATEREFEPVLPAFINLANDMPGDVVFVIDDFHLVEDSAIHQAVTYLLDHLPPMLHFVLAGRGEPPLPLARYRAHRELMELRAEDLRFLQEETADFLNETMELDLQHEEVARLQTELEGWITGLQLVALSLQRRPAGMEKLALHAAPELSKPRTEGGGLAVSGRHRFIADYLSEDVLVHLPDDTRRFLLQTSILDDLCASLCDAVSCREDSQAVLESLERQNLFVTPLDDNREWFRYHHLFADYLQGELDRQHPNEGLDLHRRAALWYLAHDLPEQAFRHAAAANNSELVIRILTLYVPVKGISGEIKILTEWLESLPEEWFLAHPMVRFAQACVMLFTGQFEAGASCLNEVERMAQAESDEMRHVRARVAALRCLIACYRNDLAPAEVFAEQALHDLSEEDLDLRRGIYGSLGDTYRARGRWEQAKRAYLEALELRRGPAFRVAAVHAFGALADLELRQGRLRDAASYWRKALVAIHDRANWGTLRLPLVGWVYIRMGEILYEWNELREADDLLPKGLERAELGGDVRAMIAGYLLAGRLKLAGGDIEAAGEYLERVRPLVERAPFPDWTSRFERFQVEFRLAQGRLRATVNWAEEMLRSGGFEGGTGSEEAQLTVARVLAAKGDAASLQRALALLARLLRAAESEGRAGISVEALALQALVQWRRGDQASAMTSLEHALRMAEPEGYLRLFTDLGLPMVRLLQEAYARDVMSDYVGKLLSSFGNNLPPTASTKEELPEPLSSREQEVLELVAAGLTNKEIAERLIISSETVKKHISHICEKLGVGNRTEAAARARALNLLN